MISEIFKFLIWQYLFADDVLIKKHFVNAHTTEFYGMAFKIITSKNPGFRPKCNSCDEDIIVICPITKLEDTLNFSFQNFVLEKFFKPFLLTHLHFRQNRKKYISFWSKNSFELGLSLNNCRTKRIAPPKCLGNPSSNSGVPNISLLQNPRTYKYFFFGSN